MSAVEIKQTPPTIAQKRRVKSIIRPIIVKVYRRLLRDQDATRDTLEGMLDAAYPLIKLHPLFARHALRCKLKVAKTRPAKWDLLCEVKHPNVEGPCYIVATFSWGPYRKAFVKGRRFPPAPSSTGSAVMRYTDQHRRDCVSVMNGGFKRVDRGYRLGGELLGCLYDMGWNGMEHSYDD